MNMLIIHIQLNRFLELLLFVCEICVALGAFFLWTAPWKKTIVKGNFIKYKHLKIDLQKCRQIICPQYIRIR